MSLDPASVPSVIDEDFDQLTALEKRDFIFDHGIRATAYLERLPDIHFGVVQFAESAAFSLAEHLLGDTLTCVKDELEPPKHKLFHTYGTTAKISFTPAADTSYSGIFQDQAPGLLRFSYAGPVVGVGVVPGLGLKFPIDGPHPSENAVLMRKLDPQLGPSVFAHSFTNLLPEPLPLNLIMRAVKDRFESVVEPGQGLHQPVDNLARIHVSGTLVDGETRAPYRLILQPNEAVQQATDNLEDFRLSLVAHAPVGTQIYTVLALDESTEVALGALPLEALVGHARRIGQLTTESEFIASAYGDFRLFFKHNARFLRPL